MTALLTYTFAQLQEALQEASAYATRKRIATLTEAHGFPPRLPGKAPLWSRPAVDRWFLLWGNSDAAVFVPPAIEIDTSALRDQLEKAYA